MHTRVIRWADRTTQPWRNGGGVTHELLREPGASDFALRLSIAEVATDGPFSTFPGVDRVILMLEGRGFRLSGPRGAVEIPEICAPFAFAGEDPWDCALVDGPVRDFNVMVDRRVHRASVEVAAGDVELGPRGFVLALAPTRAGDVALGRWDLLDGAGLVQLERPAVVVRLVPATPSHSAPGCSRPPARGRGKARGMPDLSPFHLAVPVHDLDAARAFYGGLLGCPEGRSSDRWVDFDLWGHQLVVHLAEGAGDRASNPVDGHDVPVPHFGVVLPWAVWERLAERLQAAGVVFGIPPGIRFAGQVGEQATMFFRDPSGNALEFKAFRDPRQLFAR